MAFFDKSSPDFVHWSLEQWHLSFRWTFRSLLHASWGGTQLRVEHANPVSKTLCSVGTWWEAGFTCQRFWDMQVGQEAIPPCLWCQLRNTVRDSRWIQSHCLERITEHMQFHRYTLYNTLYIYIYIYLICIYIYIQLYWDIFIRMMKWLIERPTCFSRPMLLPIHLASDCLGPYWCVWGTAGGRSSWRWESSQCNI